MSSLFLGHEQPTDFGDGCGFLGRIATRVLYRVQGGIAENLLQRLRIGIPHVPQETRHDSSQRRKFGAHEIVVVHGLAFQGRGRRREGSGCYPAPHHHSIGSSASSCKLATANRGGAPSHASHQLGRVTCGNEPVAPGADAAAGSASREPGTLSAAGRHRAHGGRFLPRLAGAFGLRSHSGTFALLVAVPLAACEPDHIGARDTLREWGYTGIGITAGPVFGRPCRWREPFAVRFTAHDERGALAAGWLCASDESADDARILLDGAPT